MSGTSYVVDVLWPENQGYLSVIAKSTSGQWSAWTYNGYADPTPYDC